MKRRVLAVDPGSRSLGFGVVDFTERELSYIDSRAFDYCDAKSYFDRLSLIYQDISKIVQEYEPSEIAMEGLIYVKSPTALIKLAQARGAMIASFADKFPEKVFEYAPNLVKSTVTGHGHAGKKNVESMVQAMLGVDNFSSHDESDALAVALCHILHCKSFKGKVKISTARMRA